MTKAEKIIPKILLFLVLVGGIGLCAIVGDTNVNISCSEKLGKCIVDGKNVFHPSQNEYKEIPLSQIYAVEYEPGSLNARSGRASYISLLTSDDDNQIILGHWFGKQGKVKKIDTYIKNKTGNVEVEFKSFLARSFIVMLTILFLFLSRCYFFNKDT